MQQGPPPAVEPVTPPPHDEEPRTPSPAHDVAPQSPDGEVEFVSPPSEASAILDDDNGVPRRFRTVDNVLATGPALELDAEDLHLLAVEEPSTFAEAKREDCWRAAMIEEI